MSLTLNVQLLDRRLPPRQLRGKIVDLAHLRSPPFTAFTSACFIGYLGLYTGTFLPFPHLPFHWYIGEIRSINLYRNCRSIIRHLCKRSVYTRIDRQRCFLRWTVVYWISGRQVRTFLLPLRVVLTMQR